MFPENSDEDVRAILAHIGVSEEQSRKQIIFETNERKKKGTAKHPFVTPCSAFDAIKKFVDLRGAISKKTIKAFAAYSQNEEEQKMMMEIAAKKELLENKVSSKHHGLLALLTSLFPSCKPSLAALLQLSQRIMPRYYTIASSAVKHPAKIRIAISLTVDSIDGSSVYGFNSLYLKKLHDASQLPGAKEAHCNIFIKDSMFEIPKECGPLVMVGPGTGVVPFIGFIEDFETNKPEQSTHLYFGCRSKD